MRASSTSCRARAPATEELEQGGGALGSALSSALVDLVGEAGAFVVLVAIVLGGLLLLFDITLVAFVSPFVAFGRAIGTAVGSGASSAVEARRVRREEVAARPLVAMPVARATIDAPRGRLSRGFEPPPELPDAAPEPGAAEPDRVERRTGAASGCQGVLWPRAAAASLGAAALATASAPTAMPPGGAMSASGTLATAAGLDLDIGVPARPLPHERPWTLPRITLLDPDTETADAVLHDHVRNVRIIEEKLRSFQIPAVVVATNTGPVVTQYEVRPDARVKLSRIEGLADDLAMALAARTHPHRGADPRARRRRHRDPQPRLGDGGLPAAPRGRPA